MLSHMLSSFSPAALIAPVFFASMPELRVELPKETIAVLDGKCAATGQCRTELVNDILKNWADQQIREAIMICRVAGVNPARAERRRK